MKLNEAIVLKNAFCAKKLGNIGSIANNYN